MNEPFAVTAYRAQALAMAQTLSECDAWSQRYGLTLTDAQITNLIQSRQESLAYTGRIELNESVLPKLIYAFCDSPYLQRDAYADTLAALQELFYTLKNEVDDALSDEELIQAMAHLYNRKAHGSLEYLENITFGDLSRALGRESDEEEEADDDWLD